VLQVICLKLNSFIKICLDTDISKGSVATHLRRGGIFNDDIITNFLLILTVKQFENWSIFDEDKAYRMCAKFLGHRVQGGFKKVKHYHESS